MSGAAAPAAARPLPSSAALLAPAVLAAALAAVTLLRMPAAWESGNSLNHVSGAWMALADDLAHGTFYRPLHDPALGYGGTRFFPLSFVLQAALLRAGVPLLAAGYLLSLVAGLAAAAGAAAFLRRSGHAPWAAAALAALPLAGFAGQLAMGAARGDLLAAALSTWALAALLPAPAAGGRRGGVAGSAALFALAFLAKPTALAPAAAGVAWLALRGERGRALRLAAASLAGCAAGIGLVELLSGGRFLALVAALGGGGGGVAELLRAPLRLATLLVHEDPAGLALLLAGAAALVRPGRREEASPGLLLAALWLVVGLGATLATLASPGTGVNHLLDVEVPAGLLAATRLASSPGRLARAGTALAAAAGLATAAGMWHRDVGSGRLAAARTALVAAGAGGAPLLSEDPLLPLAAGERPVLLDAWMFRLASARSPELAAPMIEALREGRFRAVVLLHDASGSGADAWFAGDMGPAALAEVRSRWRASIVAGPYHVYEYEGEAERGR